MSRPDCITVKELKDLLDSLPTGSEELPVYIQPYHWVGRRHINTTFNVKTDDGAYIIGGDLADKSSISNRHVFLILGEGFGW